MAMMSDIKSPRLVQRKCGGWLALSPAGDSLQFGVAAESSDAAEQKYRSSRAEWKRALELAAVAIS